MAEPSLIPSGFREALSKAADSSIDTYNAALKAARLRSWSDERESREQFMEDIGRGWIVPEDWDADRAEVGWGLTVQDPKYMKALGLAPREELANTSIKGAMQHGFRYDHGKSGRYMGAGPLGTPVYVDQGFYGGAFNRSLKEGGFKGKLGAFAPGGTYVTTGGADTGTLGHELGHAKQHVMEDQRGEGPFRKMRAGDLALTWDSSAAEAASEAVASYLGRRIIRSKKGWGAASDDKSWAAYDGLPTYLRLLDDGGKDPEKMELKNFFRFLREYEKQYPGIYDETIRAIKEYDTLVAPKSINDTSRGDWSEEGLEYMKKWRKEKGLKEVPTGNIYERALEMGPYSQALTVPSDRRAV